MVIGFISQIIYAHDKNEVGSTKLIEFVQQREKELVALDKKVANLWKQCISIDVSVTHSGDVKTTTTTYGRQPFCTDEMLQDLYESRKRLKNFEENTKKQIAEIMKDGISIHATDKHGKTALSYCKSRDVYNALRSQGALFQIDSFSDINQSQLLATGLVAAAWATFLAMTLAPVTPADTCHARNAAINIRDKQGRTPLMNYVIEQEIAIDPYRVGYTILPSFLSEIKDVITKMVKQGADLSMQDFKGKTVMDYCKTKAIYQYLHSLGAPMNFDAWLSCYHNAVIGLSLVSAVALIAVICSAQNYRGRDSGGLFVDESLEKIFKSE